MCIFHLEPRVFGAGFFDSGGKIGLLFHLFLKLHLSHDFTFRLCLSSNLSVFDVSRIGNRKETRPESSSHSWCCLCMDCRIGAVLRSSICTFLAIFGPGVGRIHFCFICLDLDFGLTLKTRKMALCFSIDVCWLNVTSGVALCHSS